MQEALSAHSYCIYQTRKFGTDVVGPEEGKEFDWGIDFCKWEEFHNDFIRKIPSEERNLFEKAMETGEGVERFIPKEDWREYKLSSQDMMRFKRMMSEES